MNRATFKVAVSSLVVLVAVGAAIWLYRPAPVFYLLSKLGIGSPTLIGKSEVVMTDGWFVHWQSEGTYSSDILGPQFLPRPNIVLTKMQVGALRPANQIIVTDLAKQQPSGCARAAGAPDTQRRVYPWGTAFMADPEKAVAIVPEHCLAIASPTGSRPQLESALGEIVAIRRGAR